MSKLLQEYDAHKSDPGSGAAQAEFQAKVAFQVVVDHPDCFSSEAVAAAKRVLARSDAQDAKPEEHWWLGGIGQ